MEKVVVPKGYQTVMPYLVLKNAAGFLDFTKKVFSATEKMLIMRDELHIMHAELQIGDSTIMFADSTEQYKSATANLFIYVEDADATYQKALEEGATTVTELSNQDYGRSGGVTDAYGNTWWITSNLDGL